MQYPWLLQKTMLISRCKKIFYLVTVLLLCQAQAVIASSYFSMADGGETPENQMKFTDGKISAMVGESLSLWENHWAGVFLLPAIEIGNFQTGQSSPHQMWRGKAGLSAQWDIPMKSLPYLETGFAHESDHVSDEESYKKKYFVSEGKYLDNRSLRSFEYFFLGIPLRLYPGQKWKTESMAILRIFTPPVNSHAPFAQKAGFAFSGSLSYSPGIDFSFFLKLLADKTIGDYTPYMDSYKPELERNNFSRYGVRLGMDIRLAKVMVSPSLGYFHGTGYGMDFMERVSGAVFQISVNRILTDERNPDTPPDFPE